MPPLIVDLVVRLTVARQIRVFDIGLGAVHSVIGSNFCGPGTDHTTLPA